MGTAMIVQEHPFIGFLVVWIIVFLSCVFKSSVTGDGFLAMLCGSFLCFGMVAIVICSPKVNDYVMYRGYLEALLLLSFVIASVRLIRHYWDDMSRWLCFYKEQFQKWQERRRNISDVKKIYRESRVPPKTKAKLGEAIAEWEESKRKLPLLAASLKNLEAELVRMDKAIAKAKAGQAKKQLDADITESYAVIVGDLLEQWEKLHQLIAEVKKEIAVRKERMAMIANFFQDIPEQAEVYTDYDKFTAETMKLQKDLKEDLVKVPK